MSHPSYCGDCVINSSTAKRICRYFLVVRAQYQVPQPLYTLVTVSQSAAASALLTRAELDDYTDFTALLRAEPTLTRTINLGGEIASRVELINRNKAAMILASQNINSTD